SLRRPGRHLRARRDPLRAAHRPASVPQAGLATGTARGDPPRRTDPATADCHLTAGEAGGDLPQGDGPRSGGALCLGWRAGEGPPRLPQATTEGILEMRLPSSPVRLPARLYWIRAPDGNGPARCCNRGGQTVSVSHADLPAIEGTGDPE